MTTEDAVGDWQRLDPKTVWVTAVALAGVAGAAGVPIVLGIANGGGPWRLALVLVLVAAGLLVAGGSAADYVRLRKTSYRVTDTKVEVRTGIVQRNHRAVHRERIRTVNLTAYPWYRMFAVTKVSIGTGEDSGSAGSQLVLDGLNRTVAGQLRRDLLHRPANPAEPDDAPALAVLDWQWVRYAPFSIWPGVLGVAAGGLAWQAAQVLGFEGSLLGWIREFIDAYTWWAFVPLVALLALLAGLIATVAFFVESWWRYRLSREPGALLQVRRGLVAQRSLSVAEDRLRGIELVEPFGVRALGAGRLEAVATGIKENRPDQKQIETKVLLPESPRAHAETVAAEILREPESPTSAALTRHPPAARRKRLLWAFAAVVAVSGVLFVLGLLLTEVLLHIAWISAVVLTPFAVFAALQSYRNLGHGETQRYAVISYGVLARHTAALRRSGVIGWTLTQTPFQRRKGLITVSATTAATKGAYTSRDAATTDALRWSDAMVPGLLEPFVERG